MTALRRPAGILFWLLAALALRGIALDGDGLWMDEGYTAWTAHLGQEEHREARLHDDAPPLYYAIQRVLLPHLPPGEGSVRLLSVAAGVASVAWLAAAPPFPASAPASVACMAAGAYGVYYGRQARSYSILFLFSFILITATARAAEGKRRWLVVVALAEGVLLWTHNVAAVLALAANVAWLLSGARLARGWIAAQAVAFAIWLPYLLQAVPQMRVHAELNLWVGDYWKEHPILLAPLLSLGLFTSGARIHPDPPIDLWRYAGPGSWIVSALLFCVVAAALFATFRKGLEREGRIAASFTLVPLLGLTLLSLIAQPSYILGRTDAVAYPGFVLWVALGLRRLPRGARAAAAGLLILGTILATASGLPLDGNRKENDRRTGLAVKSAARPGDWIVFVGLSRPSIDYYVSSGRPGRPDDSIRRLHYPSLFSRNPAAVFPTPGDSLRSWEEEAYHLRDAFEREASPEARLCVIQPVKPDRRAGLTAADLPYPGNMLAYVLRGLEPLEPLVRLRGDRVGVDWAAYLVTRAELADRDALLPVEEGR